MPDDDTNNSINKIDGENNAQGTIDGQDGQGHGNDETSLELNHDRIELYPERQRKMMTDAISKQQIVCLDNLPIVIESRFLMLL